MKRATRQLRQSALRSAGAAGLVLIALAGAARAQDTQFLFDPAGNLLLEITQIGAAPQITGQPASQILTANETASFSVVVADNLNVSYQWQFGGSAIAGATTDTLLVSNVTAASEGPYSVVVANGFGSVTSAPAMLWFDGNGNGLPDSWEMAHFGNLNQTATGDYDFDGVSNLDEFLEGTDPKDPNSFNPRLYIQTTDFGVAVAIPPVRYYSKGAVATVLALPDPGATFLGWSGAATGIKPEISLLMTGHKTLIAAFGPATAPPLVITAAPTASGAGGISFSWSSVPGLSYQLQFKADLEQTTWTNLGPPIVATDYTASAADSTTTDVQRFYRVILAP